MGFDFAAVMHYEFAHCHIDKAIQLLEAEDRPPPLREVVCCWERIGYGLELNHVCPRPVWVKAEDHFEHLAARPALPSYVADFGTPEGFFLTFGEDALVVVHLLRWRQFLLYENWHRAMLDAMAWLRDTLGADTCLIAHDCHQAIYDIRNGKSRYREAIDEAVTRGEVKPISMLNPGNVDNATAFEKWMYRLEK